MQVTVLERLGRFLQGRWSLHWGPGLSLTASIAGSFTLATGCSLVGVRLFKPLIA